MAKKIYRIRNRETNKCLYKHKCDIFDEALDNLKENHAELAEEDIDGPRPESGLMWTVEYLK